MQFAEYHVPFVKPQNGPEQFFRMFYEGDTLFGLQFFDGEISDRKVFEEATSSLEETFADRVYSELTQYLSGERTEFSFHIEMKGTSFQKKVWSALLEIPYGKTATYQEIAVNVGSPKAARAVGMACNRNPLMIVVPCHRVIGANGKLTGYAGGLEMKTRLLELEKDAANRDVI